MMRVVLDCIVQQNPGAAGVLVRKSPALSSFAGGLSPECQILIITNEEQVNVENTGNINIHFFHSPGNVLAQLINKRRLKQLIYRWNPDVVIHSGSLPFIHNKNNVLYINNPEASAGVLRKPGQLKKFFAASSFIQQQLQLNYSIPTDKIIITPATGSTMYKPISWDEKETIKSKASGGAEFFLYNHIPSSQNDFVLLLKAFSAFKKRLQTNMKLLVPCSMPATNRRFTQLLATYKFKEDVLFTGVVTAEQLAELTAAAYAIILSAEKDGFSQLQEMIRCAVPVLVLQPDEWTKDEDCFEYANSQSAEEIAGKLMLLYKNESHRHQLISQSQQLLPQFSAAATAGTFRNALLQTVAE